MAQPLTLPLEASLVVASDIHLVSVDDAKGRILLKMLDEVARGQVEVCVLLGDIFDFCLGSSRYFQRKFAPLGEALTRVARSGTRMIFFEGNHEFDLPRFGWEGVEFIANGDHAIELADGTRIKMAHGDLIFSSPVYRAFRTVVKSKLVTFVASQMPGRFMESFALKNAEVSRAQDEYRDMNHASLLEAANTWIDRDECHHGIFGHFHVPYAEPRPGGQGKLLSMDCWDKPNFLVYRDGEFARIYFEGELSAPTVIAAQSYLRSAP